MRKGVWQLSLMTSLSTAAQVVSLLRSAVTARTFGASAEYDAFVLSRSVISLGLILIGTGISVVLVPAFVQGRDRKQIDGFITFLLFGGLLVGAVCALGARSFMRLAGAHPEVVAAAAGLPLIMLMAQYFGSMLSITGAYLNANDFFGLPQIVTTSSAAVQLVFIVYDPHLTVKRIALYILCCQGVAFFVMLALAVKRGFRFRLCFNWRRDGAIELIMLLLPALVSSGVDQFSTFIDSTLAARIGLGMPTILSYSIAIYSMAQYILLGNVQTFAYSKLARASVAGGKRQTFTRYGTLGVALAMLACSGWIVIGDLAARILLGERGFLPEQLQAVEICAFVLILSLVPAAVRGLLYNQLNADLDTRSPVVNSLVASGVNLIVSIIASQFIGIYGLVLGTLIASYLSLLTISLKIKKRYSLNWSDAYDFASRIAVLLVIFSVATACGKIAVHLIRGTGVAAGFVGALVIITISATGLWVLRRRCLLL